MALEIGAWIQKLFGKVEVSNEEDRKVKGDMTPKEAGEAMQTALSGEISEVDNSQLPVMPESQMAEKQPEKSFWQRPLGKFLKNAGIVVGSAAVVGLAGWGIAAMAGIGTKGIVALGVAVGGALGLTSCKKDRPEDLIYNEQTNVTVVNNITINNDALAAAIQELTNQQNIQNQELLKILNKILAKLEEIQANTGTIVGQQAALINAITNLITTVGTNHQDLMAILSQILDKMDEMDEHQTQNFAMVLNAISTMQGDVTNILQTLLAMDQHQHQWFNQILAKLTQMGGDIQALLAAMNEHTELLTQILAKLNNLQATVQNGIVQILAKLDQIDEHNQEGFLAVINKLDQLDVHLQEGVLAILNKLDQLDQHQQAGILAILGRFDTLDQNMLNIVEELINIQIAVNTGNSNVEALIQHMIGQLGSLQEGQAEQLQTLIQILNAIPSGSPEVNLQHIEELLTQILQQEQTNGNMLENVNYNVAVIATTTQSLVQLMYQVIDNEEIQNDWLENIFNKIPTNPGGCDCDCERIIELLIQIEQHLQNGDWNHEGIDDEFDDILG